MSNNDSSHSIDDRIRALTEEFNLAESVDLGTASKATLVLNHERLRGALADSLRLIHELRKSRSDD